MSINLIKGKTINLQKVDNSSVVSNLSKLTIGLGWDIAKGEDYDLDACALLLDSNGLLTSNSDIVSYQNTKHSSGTVYSTGDNLTGEGEGDDEQIIVNLLDVPKKYKEIIFYATIYSGRSRGQNFAGVKNAFIRAVDGNKKELLKYEMSGDSSLKNKRSFVFGKVVRTENNEWEFNAIGEPYDTDNLNDIANLYKKGIATPKTTTVDSSTTVDTEVKQPRKKLFGIF